MSFDHTILKGTTSKIIEVMLRDDSTGQGKTAVAHGDVTASYIREGSTRVAITLASGSAGDAYSSGKWAEVDATNTPGEFQFHAPNAALADGVDAVTFFFKVSGVIDKQVRIALIDVDLRDATKAGLSDIGSIKTFTDASTAQTGDNYAVLATGIDSLDRNDTLIEQLQVIQTLIEHQRGAHTHQPIGNIFFVDPVNGDTHASGNRGGITDPYSGVQDCHDNGVTDSNHDTIILLSGAAAGPTTLTEDVTLSKRYLFIRGPGRDFMWTRSGNGDTISVTADGIELSGFQIETAATGSGAGVQATDADFLRVHECWINDTQGDGINILRGSNCQIHDNVFTDTGQGGSGEGIHIRGTAGSSNRNHIYENIFHQCAGDGVKIEDGTTNQTYIEKNRFEGCTGYGINIGASSMDAFLTENVYGGNTSGDVNDAGTDTIRQNDQQWAYGDSNGRSDVGSVDGQAATAGGAIDFDDIAGIKAKTDQLNFTGSYVDANMETAQATAAATIGGQVWEEFTVAHNSASTFGNAFNTGITAWVTATGFSTLTTADIDARLAAIHLDHLLAVDYDPDSKPGSATALLNELIESNSGVSRYTAAALAQAPSGGGGGDATAANQTTIITHLTDIKDNNAGADYDASTDSLEAIRNRGDAAWTTGSETGSGARTITVTVDDGTDTLENAKVTFTEGANVFTGTTDSSGQIDSFNLDDATYVVAITKAGYTYAGSNYVVSGDATPTFSMTAQSGDSTVGWPG